MTLHNPGLRGRLSPLLLPVAALLLLLLLHGGNLATAWRLNRGYVQTLKQWQTPLDEGVDRYTWRARAGSTTLTLDALPPADRLAPATAHSVGRLLWLNGADTQAVDYLADACAGGAILSCNDFLSAVSHSGDAGRTIGEFEATPSVPLFAAVRDSLVWAYVQEGQLLPVEIGAEAADNLAVLATARPLPGLEAAYRRALTEFALAAVWPAEPRLLPAMTAAADQLVVAGVWDAALRARVAAFWQWQYPQPGAPATALPTRPAATAAPGNLLAALDPASVGRPASDWQAGNYLGSGGAFLAGPDADATLRIDGLWYGGSGFFGVVARPRTSAGGSYFLPIAAGQRYELSGFVRTAGVGEITSINVGNSEVGLFDLALPATGGTWQPISATACSAAANEQMMQILLRLQSAGSVWFGDLALRPVAGGCPVANTTVGGL